MKDYNKGATVVKMAVIGDVFKDRLKPIPQDQIRSFKYTLMGDNAFTFVIELVNYDDAFLTSITKSVNTMISNAGVPDYTNINPDASNLESLPKLLIQFGYEDPLGKSILSKVLFANVSDCQYKFTQGSEKILIITAVFDPDGPGDEPTDMNIYKSSQVIDVIFPENNKSSSARCFFKRASSEEKNPNEYITYYDILIQTVKDLVSFKDGSQFTHLEPTKEQKDRTATRVNRYLKRALSNDPTRGGNFLDKMKDGLSDPKDLAIDSLSLMPETARKLFEEWGGFGGTQFELLSEFSKELGLGFIRKYEEYSAYDSITKSLSNFYTGVKNLVVGEYIPPPYLTGEAHPTPEDAWKPAKASIPVSYDIANYSGQNLVDQIYAATDLNGPTNEAPGDSFKARVANINDEQRQKVVAGETIQQTAVIYEPPEFNGVSVPIHLIYSDMVLTSSDTEEINILSLGDRCVEIDRTLYSALQRTEELPAIRKEAQRAKEAASSPEDDGINLAGMEHEEKINAFNRNIIVTAISEEGESIYQTVDGLIKAYNDRFARGNKYFEVEVLYEATASSGDFNTILEEHENNPLATRVLQCTIGLTKNVTEYKELKRDFEILSSPITKESEEHFLINLDYGRNTSIVKFFDFNGDIRWLRNISTNIATNNYIGNVYAFLETGVIHKSYVDIVHLLLKDKGFINAMSKANTKINDLSEDQDSESDIQGTLLALEKQFEEVITNSTTPGNADTDHYYGVSPISKEDLENLSYVQDYVNSGRARGYLERSLGDAFNDQMSSFNLFLASLFNTESLKLLMDPQGADQNYIIKPSNVFDHVASDDRSAEVMQKLSLYEKNMNMFAEVQIKTLGVPELSTMTDITQRGVNFSIYDPESNFDTRSGKRKGKHWLSGAYRIMALSHSISPSEGYSSELTLAKIISESKPNS